MASNNNVGLQSEDGTHDLLHEQNSEQTVPVDVTHSILYEVNSDLTLAILPPDSNYSIRCNCEIAVLAGEIFLNGFNMTPEAEYNIVCSIDTHSRLMLFVQKYSCSTDSKIIDDLKNIGPVMEKLISQPFGAVLSIRRRTLYIESVYLNLCGPIGEGLIDSVPYFQIFSSISKAFVITEEWAGIVDKINEAPRVAVCGPVNSGKSSFCRYIVNTFLNKHKKVLFLETDIGQSELTPTGMISLSLLQAPLLGPPYSHIRPVFTSHLTGNETNKLTCQAYCLGVTAPISIIESYIAKLRLLVHQARSLKIPIIINNMGWTKGLGVLLHADILRIVCPDHIISLKTGPRDLPPIQDVLVMDGITTKPEEFDIMDPVIHNVTGYSNHSTDQKSFAPFELRHMSLLSYFAPIYQEDKLAPPFRVSWKFISVIIPESVEKDHAAYCINASVVGLLGGGPTETEDGILNVIEDDHRPCLGLGIVRSVDVKGHYLYVNTPLSLGDLDNVYVVKHTNIPIPHLPKGALPTPYLSNLAANEIMGVGSRTQRNNLKRKYVGQDQSKIN